MAEIRLIFEKQHWHILLLGALLFLLTLAGRLEGIWQGEVWGVSTRTWFYAALSNSIGHQFYVWLVWRLELHLNMFTRSMGKSAFRIYGGIFIIFLVMRPVLLTLLAYANRDTVPAGRAFMTAGAVALLLPVLWLGDSFLRYFGFSRAFGADHFDPKYRSLPLVQEGIFRFTPNAMYTFGFFVLWSIALAFASVAALVLALFSHLYIWVHYFFTEKPDMERIYGKASGAEK